MTYLNKLASLALTWAALFQSGATLSSPGEEVSVQQISGSRTLESAATLHIATLNLAHGRGSALNQLLVSENKTRKNLATVGQFMRDKDIHIAALQEADSPSWWSGGFDHTTFVAQLGGFGWYTSSPHANLGIGRYGTAVVSVLPIRSATSHNFPPTPPTARKGFTMAKISWPVNGTETRLDVVSIHMDFSRKSVRQTQLRELRAALAGRDNPLVIMGDFNSVEIAHQLMREEDDDGRHLHTAGGNGKPWHSYKDKRLDWILLSGELEFVEYSTYPDALSDHRLVAARVALKQAPVEEEQP